MHLPNPKLFLGCDIGGAKELRVIYFPTNWGAKEPRNLPKSQTLRCRPRMRRSTSNVVFWRTRAPEKLHIGHQVRGSPEPLSVQEDLCLKLQQQWSVEPLLVRVLRHMIIPPGYIRIIISHYKDPYYCHQSAEWQLIVISHEKAQW